MDNPGDCQTSAADSTSVKESSSPSSNCGSSNKMNTETHVSSSIETFIACSSSNIENTESKPLSPPANSSKTKAQQTQHYQFRAPQQYVKHKKTSSTLFKKNKTWNKRQNKNGKVTNQNGLPIPGHHLGVNLAVNSGNSNNSTPGGNVHTNSTSKADLENIQNLRNQPGGYHYYHRTAGIVERGGTIVEVMPSVGPLGPDKIPFGHGHVKQQSYKKMQMHNRGHHHHILCAGAAHNTHGASLPLNCCHINGCVGHNAKDTVSHNGSLGTSANANVSCCMRSKFFLPDKRPRKEVIIPPTKFLLGGNISDPLNLNSLQNETSNTSTNNTPATTPRRSPITTPPKVEVIIPPNIHDPLHLLDPVDTMEYEKQLTSPMKRSCKTAAGFRHHKHRHRKNRKPKRRRNDSYNSNATTSSFLTNSEPEDITTTIGNTSISTSESTKIMLSLPNVENTNTIAINSTALSEKPNERKEKIEKELLQINKDSTEMSALLQAATPLAGKPIKENVALVELFSHDTEQMQEEKLTTVDKEKTTTTIASVQGMRTENADSITFKGNIAAVDLESRERRISRDLRLDLSSTTSSTCSIVSGNSGALCSDSLGGAVANDGTVSGSGLSVGVSSRKRKISESSTTQKPKKHGRYDLLDKIVSPVVPQPGAWKRPPRLAATGARKPVTRRSRSASESEILSPIDESIKCKNDEAGQEDTSDVKIETISETGLGSPLSTTSATTSLAAGEIDPSSETTIVEPITNIKEEKFKLTQRSVKMPKFPSNGAKYRYGNYDRYAGCRNLTELMDVRLQVFQRNVELFENKDILDIGCNSGYISISIGRNLAPKSVLGIDIDEKLITKARMNLALHVRIPIDEKKQIKKEEKFDSNEDQKHDPTENNNKKLKKCRRKRARRKNKNIHMQMQPIHHIHPLIHHHHMQMHYTSMKLRELKVDSKELFPISFPLTYGPILKVTGPSQLSSCSSTKNTPSHPLENVNTSSNSETGANTTPASSTKTASFHHANSSSPVNTFPNNIYFRQTNYVLKDEAQLANETQLYDVIICLSVTKWIHLNFGDNGLKMAFKRMFNQLRPGGKLILEAQNWASYKKKKNLTEDIYLNYRKIEFFPNKFHEYLLSSEVGFSHSYTLGVPRHLNKGFCRPIQLYAKGDYTPNHVRWSDAYYPQTPYEAYRGIYATMPPRPEVCQMSSTRSQTYDTPHYTGGASSGPYSCRQTPMHQPTSQYYNPLETDSYQPSYDMEYLNHMYVFASPLYQTVWSPPASMRRTSSTHTPIYGSVREAEIDGDGYIGPSGGGSYHRHVYPPNDDTMSPNANATNAFNSIRDPDTDDSNQPPGSHVYATTCGESSSSPHVNHNYSEAIESLLDDEQNANNNEI